uniref:Uncharacterized protein n=1 Tax=Anopheles melas TaxID=34690 RepID=A0A182TSU1_9DIPT
MADISSSIRTSSSSAAGGFCTSSLCSAACTFSFSCFSLRSSSVSTVSMRSRISSFSTSSDFLSLLSVPSASPSTSRSLLEISSTVCGCGGILSSTIVVAGAGAKIISGCSGTTAPGSTVLPSAVRTGAPSTSSCCSFCFSFSSSRSSLILRSSSLITSIFVLLSILPSRSPMAAFVTVATESGRDEIVAFSLSPVVMFSGSTSARDSSSSDGGTFSFRLRLIHSCSCDLSRSSEAPYARIPRARQAACSSDRFSDAMPSFWMVRSSAARLRSFRRSWNRSKFEVPIGDTSSTRHSACSCWRLSESSVISSSNSLENFSISSFEMVKFSVVRMRVKNSLKSLAACDRCSLFWTAMSSSVFCRNLAISIFTLRFCLILSSRSVAVWKVEGSMPGNSLIASGSSSSINGTMINTENGTSRNRSEVVRMSSLCSRRVNVFPLSTRHSSFRLMLMSMNSNRKPW